MDGSCRWLSSARRNHKTVLPDIPPPQNLVMAPELPGFVFDPVKKRYFKIIKGAVVPPAASAGSNLAQYTTNAIQTQKRDASHTERVRREHGKRTGPNPSPLHILTSPALKLGAIKRSRLRKVVTAYESSVWQRRCLIDLGACVSPRSLRRGSPLSVMLANGWLYYAEDTGRVLRFAVGGLGGSHPMSSTQTDVQEVLGSHARGLGQVVSTGSTLIWFHRKESLEASEESILSGTARVEMTQARLSSGTNPTETHMVVPLSRLVFSVSFRNGILVVGQEDRLTLFPNVEVGLVQRVYHLREAVLALDQRDSLIAAGCRLGRVWLLDPTGPSLAYNFKDKAKRAAVQSLRHTGPVLHVRFVDHKRALVSGLKGIGLYSLDGALLFTYAYVANPNMTTQVFAYSSKARQFAVTDAKNSIRVYGLDDPRPLSVNGLTGLESVQAMTFVERGLVVFDQGLVKVFSPSEGGGCG